MHSPFVFDFIQHVLEPHQFYHFEQLHQLRKELATNENKLQIHDLGAGSGVSRKTEKTISRILSSAVSPAVVSEVLFRLVNYYNLRKKIELGTSIGVNSLYLAMADSRSELYTLEGSPQIAQFARAQFDMIQTGNITLIEGDFADTLPQALNQMEKVDFAFIDGNHRSEPTWQYYEMILEKCHSKSVLVFDDIHWSTDMEEVWDRIVRDKRNAVTIDWFRLGFVFFRHGIEKQHFVLKQRP